MKTHRTIVVAAIVGSFVVGIVVGKPLWTFPIMICVVCALRYWASGVEHHRLVPTGQTHRTTRQIETELYGRPLKVADLASGAWAASTGLLLGAFIHGLLIAIGLGGITLG